MSHRIFLGSSTEALPITEALVSLLDHDFAPAPWHADVFLPGSFTIENLLREASSADFAVFVFADDDVVRLRDKTYNTTRDNVVFELGLFLSRLGRERCFFLLPRNAATFRVPTDLQGITPLTYDSQRAKSEPKAALVAAVGDLKSHLRRLIDGDGTTLSLSGRWIQNWHVKSTHYPTENPEEATVTQIGAQFSATSSANGRPFIIDGQVQRGNIITGTWYDRAVGPTYFGAFQLVIDPMVQRLFGKWIGFTDSNRVQEGDWEWTRVIEPL